MQTNRSEAYSGRYEDIVTERREKKQKSEDSEFHCPYL